MKKTLLKFLGLFLPLAVSAADVKISQLPLNSLPSTVNTNDSFPYVNSAGAGTTQRLLISDLPSTPAFVSKFNLYATTSALALAVPSQTGNSGKFLTTNGSSTSWASVSGTGTVTSVGLTMPGIFSVSGSPVTTTGTLAVSALGTSGGIPYFSNGTALASSAALAQNQIVLGGGVGGAPATLGSLGTSAQVLHGNASGAPTWGSVALSSDVSGTLPVGNGGTGATTLTSGAPLIGNGTSAISAGSKSGNTTTFATTSGTMTSGDCVQIDASGNLVAAGAACGSGSGAVTSVGLTVPATSIFGVTGSPVTTTGDLGLTTTGTSGGVPYFSSSSQLASSAALTANALVLGGGAGVAPASLGSLGTTSTVLIGNAAGAPSFGAVALGSMVSGQLPLTNGGSNKSITAAAGGVLYTDSDSFEVTSAGTSGQFLKSNGTSAPVFTSFTAPTVQKFTSGSGTYTTPANVLYIRVRMVGGGGGGSNSGTGGLANGTTGGQSTFGTTLLSASGGVGAGSGGGANGGPGGGASLGSGPIGTVVSGGSGQGTGSNGTSGARIIGGQGGSTCLGGNGGGGAGGSAGQDGAANTGGGGGGGGFTTTSNGTGGAGGGGGGCVEAIITSPSGTYSYAVGTGGSGASAGTGGTAGGAGGSGYIEVTEFYH